VDGSLASPPPLSRPPSVDSPVTTPRKEVGVDPNSQPPTAPSEAACVVPAITKALPIEEPLAVNGSGHVSTS
jgi:hypothetical protein